MYNLISWKKYLKKPQMLVQLFVYLSGLGLRFPSAPKAFTASSTAFLGNPISIKVWTFPVGGGDDEVFLNRRLRLRKSFAVTDRGCKDDDGAGWVDFCSPPF